MSELKSFTRHYITSKLNGIILPIREILFSGDPRILEGISNPTDTQNVEQLQTVTSGLSQCMIPIDQPTEEKGAEILRQGLTNLINRIDGNLSGDTIKEWIATAEGVKNLSLVYNLLRLHSIFFPNEIADEVSGYLTSGTDITKMKKYRVLQFLGRTGHPELIKRIISYTWIQSRLIHVIEELQQYAQRNPEFIKNLVTDSLSKRDLLNITEKDIDLIKKIIDQEGCLREVERGHHIHLVKELSFTELSNALRNTYGYRTKFFKKFLQRYHRKHFFLREQKVEVSTRFSPLSSSPPRSDPLTLDPTAQSKTYRNVLMVSPFQPEVNFERDASILTRYLEEEEKKLMEQIKKKPRKIDLPYTRKFRISFPDLLEKLGEETGSMKHRGYLKQMKTNMNWKHVFNVEPYIQLKPTGGYNRKFVNSINKMFSERHKSVRGKETKNEDEETEDEDLLPSPVPKSEEIQEIVSPVRIDVRIPVSEIEKKNVKQFIAYINCWHFDKFQILPGDSTSKNKIPMIRKQMVDLKDVSKLTFSRRKIAVLELLALLKKEKPKKYGYITESDFTRWIGQNFPERCIVVGDDGEEIGYHLLFDDDILFRMNLFRVIQFINYNSRRDRNGFGVPFVEILIYCRKELKLKHFKKTILEKYLKQYNNVFKFCQVVSLRKKEKKKANKANEMTADTIGMGSGGSSGGSRSKVLKSSIFGSRGGMTRRGTARGRARGGSRGRGHFHVRRGSSSPPKNFHGRQRRHHIDGININSEMVKKKKRHSLTSPIGKKPHFRIESSAIAQEIIGMNRKKKKKKKTNVIYQPKFRNPATITDSETGEIVKLNHNIRGKNVIFQPQERRRATITDSETGEIVDLDDSPSLSRYQEEEEEEEEEEELKLRAFKAPNPMDPPFFPSYHKPRQYNTNTYEPPSPTRKSMFGNKKASRGRKQIKRGKGHSNQN